MIDLLQSRTIEARSLWSGTIRERLNSLALEGHPVSTDVSGSLSLFCQERSVVSEDALSLLMARSFLASGDADAAEWILCQDGFCKKHSAAWLGVLSIEYSFPELYPLFSAHVLRPLFLSSVMGDHVWVLDLDAVEVSDAERHELILFQTLRVLIEHVSTVWKKSNGQGALGVKGLSRLIGDSADSAELFFYHMRDVLHRCADKEGWHIVPSLLKIDL